MQDADFSLSESVAISRYLIARYGSEETLHTPGALETQAREDEGFPMSMASWTKPRFTSCRHGDLKTIYGEAPAAVESAKVYAEKHLAVIAQHLTAKTLVNGRFGLADVMLVSCLTGPRGTALTCTPSLCATEPSPSTRSLSAGLRHQLCRCCQSLDLADSSVQ